MLLEPLHARADGRLRDRLATGSSGVASHGSGARKSDQAGVRGITVLGAAEREQAEEPQRNLTSAPNVGVLTSRCLGETSRKSCQMAGMRPRVIVFDELICGIGARSLSLLIFQRISAEPDSADGIGMSGLLD